MLPIALRNNNPLNIRYNSANKWKGLVGSEKGFCKFESLEYGYRAALVLLRNYHRKGYDTIHKIIHRWAPTSENNTAAYIDYVSRYIHVDPNVRLLNSELSRLALAMSYYEIGSRSLTPNVRIHLQCAIGKALKLCA